MGILKSQLEESIVELEKTKNDLNRQKREFEEELHKKNLLLQEKESELKMLRD